jgi:hypothetical protein
MLLVVTAVALHGKVGVVVTVQVPAPRGEVKVQSPPNFPAVICRSPALKTLAVKDDCVHDEVAGALSVLVKPMFGEWST